MSASDWSSLHGKRIKRLDVCTASGTRLRARPDAVRGRVRLPMQMRVFPGMCEFMHAVAPAGRSYVQENRDTGHLAWLDCNRRCIYTYVHRGLYKGWHATGVCRARQLIKAVVYL